VAAVVGGATDVAVVTAGATVVGDVVLGATGGATDVAVVVGDVVLGATRGATDVGDVVFGDVVGGVVVANLRRLGLVVVVVGLVVVVVGLVVVVVAPVVVVVARVVVVAVVPPYCQQPHAIVPSRFTSVCMLAIGNARASGHVVASASFAYSTLRMGLPAWTNGSSWEHSLYCQHCSFTVPSATGSMSATKASLLMPFFRNQARPNAWMSLATSVSKVT
jgi:hypothetical protein